MEDNEREFVAYSRKLLRDLKNVREALEGQNYDFAKRLLDELIEDTQGDIED